MAILCLAQDETDLRRRIENILLGTTIDGKPFTVKDLGVAGAICVLLRDAIKPNLVQTTEGTPAVVHGGPFANIAHGCNSVIATRTAMSLAPYVITEAGFGADLGAEKFYDIKCRKSGLQPALTILVATTQGLKMHGGVPVEAIKEPNIEGLKEGVKNLDRHIKNLQGFGQTVVVCFNRYAADTDEEIEFCRQHCAEMGIGFAVNNAFNEGGAGAEELANLVVNTIEETPSQPLVYAYSDEQSIEEKAQEVVRKVYGGKGAIFTPAAKKMLQKIEELGLNHYPICIAKTQYSFSADQKAYGVPEGFSIAIRDVVINQGSEFIVLIAGEILRMPGLPKVPQAEKIDIVNGEIEGLS
jgi:formate--tetrahydrofolate ligase